MSSAPWKSILKSLISENIKNLKSSTPILPMQFSTYDTLTCRPTNRSVMFRGFLGERKDEIRKNEIINYLNSISSEANLKELNPEIETDLLVITTDIRSAKVNHLLENSGFEICWWFPVTTDQFRLSGNAYILPSPINPIIAHFPSDMLLSPYSFSVDSISLIEHFDWEQERKKHWYETSSDLRATFLEPQPTQENEISNVVRELDPIGKTMEEKLLVKKALENFAIVVMKVDYIDHLKLSPTPIQTIWKFQKSDDGLNKEEWIKKTKAYIDDTYQKAISTLFDKLEQANWASTEKQPGENQLSEENQTSLATINSTETQEFPTQGNYPLTPIFNDIIANMIPMEVVDERTQFKLLRHITTNDPPALQSVNETLSSIPP
ncbi:26163_t:CDS:2 [Dentiscutata erythropus]|uniref:26163_t:CDS:1 n=1 Tax=Dentiscutata erythropus TaxID=1348616 RepID=A0A9N9EKI2_9GLOM|nr:26163_t:CDS:2 [Dentiscutata erythropus]